MSRWLALLSVGCGQTYTPCGEESGEVEGTVDTSGEVPVFDWGFGTAYAISVYETAEDGSQKEMWFAQCGGENLEEGEVFEQHACIETPIAYGEEALSEHVDMATHVPAEPLTAGATYVVRLHTMLEEGGVELEREGWLSFLDAGAGPSCFSSASSEVEFVAPEEAR